jgi:hypothetical protein
LQALHEREGFGLGEEGGPKSSVEGQLVREVLYGNRFLSSSNFFRNFAFLVKNFHSVIVLTDFTCL